MTERRTSAPTRAAVDGRAYLELRSIARKAGRASDEYLRLYALEGFLLRLAASFNSGDFVLKGGVLLAAYQLRRPTADIDFAALNTANDVESIKSLIIAVANIQLPQEQDDGLVFDTSHADAVSIREEDEYNGVRVTLQAALSTAQMRFHVDVNVGDPIWPHPQNVVIPRLLGGEIEMLGYPIPMVLAEKLVTAAQRGIASTRWRDFADVYLLTGQHSLLANDVRAAISAVADYRHTEVGSLRETLDGYAAIGQSRWLAWRVKQNLDDRLPARFADVLEPVLVFADGIRDITRVPDQGRWSPITRTWR
jgi:predicted nucleotidyltransferase component of viral defense system